MHFSIASVDPFCAPSEDGQDWQFGWIAPNLWSWFFLGQINHLPAIFHFFVLSNLTFLCRPRKMWRTHLTSWKSTRTLCFYQQISPRTNHWVHYLWTPLPEATLPIYYHWRWGWTRLNSKAILNCCTWPYSWLLWAICFRGLFPCLLFPWDVICVKFCMFCRKSIHDLLLFITSYILSSFWQI